MTTSKAIRCAGVVGLAVLSAAASLRSASARAEDGPYVGAAFGAGLANHQIVTDEVQGGGSSRSEARFDPGFAGRLIGGYSFDGILRPEAELGFQRKHGSRGGIDENVYSAMADLWVDLVHQYAYFVDFGGGLGLADVALHGGGGHDDTVSAAWQLGAGAGLDLSEHVSLAVDFRHLAGFAKSNLHVQPDERLRTRVESNVALFEIRYSFTPISGDSVLSRWLR